MGKGREEKAAKPPKRFRKLYREKSSEESHAVLVDKETGVHYLLIQNGVGCGITPLLDEEGKTVIRLIEEPALEDEPSIVME